jgi:hypothetical protein
MSLGPAKKKEKVEKKSNNTSAILFSERTIFFSHNKSA